MSRKESIGMGLDPPTARRSTIIRRGKRNKLSNKKKKRRLSCGRVSPIAERFKLKLKNCIGGGVQHPEVHVIKGRSTIINGHQTVIHIAFPIKNDAHAFRSLSLIQMRKELLGANHHSRAFLLPNGGYFSNVGATKLGSRALKALEYREAIGVAVLISTWTYSQRHPVDSSSLQQTIGELLKAGGQVEGEIMDPYCWGKGYSLLNSRGDLGALPQVNREEKRRVVLAALEKRLTHQGNIEMMDFPMKKEEIRKSRCDNQQHIKSERDKIPTDVKKPTEPEFLSEGPVLSTDEQMSEDSDKTQSFDFVADLYGTLIKAYKIESEPKENIQEESKSEIASDQGKAKKRGRKRAVLNDSLNYQDSRKKVDLHFKKTEHRMLSKSFKQTEFKRKGICGTMQKGVVDFPLENRISFAYEQSPENSSKFKPSKFVSALERRLILARKIEREPNTQIFEHL